MDRRHQGGKRLIRTDVARRPLPLDVLLPCLEGQSEASSSFGVGSDSDKATRNSSEQRLFHRHVAAGRAAKRKTETQTLGIADGDVRSPLAGSLLNRQAERVAADRKERFALVKEIRYAAIVFDKSVAVGRLHDEPADIIADDEA